MQFGYHLTLDLYNCPIETLNNMTVVYDSMLNLPPKIDMHPLTKPFVVNADANVVKDPGGYSGFVIIQESHISVHTFTKRGFVSIDVYSCKPFNRDAAKQHFIEVYKPKEVEEHFVDRGLSYPEEDIY